jgi:hypothetical protein
MTEPQQEQVLLEANHRCATTTDAGRQLRQAALRLLAQIRTDYKIAVLAPGLNANEQCWIRILSSTNQSTSRPIVATILPNASSFIAAPPTQRP